MTLENTNDHLITEKEFAGMIKRSLTTIRRDRREGRGPVFIRIGRHIRYRIADVKEYMAALTRISAILAGVRLLVMNVDEFF